MGLATQGAWNGSYVKGTTIDGVDVWNALVNNTTSPRHEMVLYYYKNSTTATTGDFVYQYDMQKFIAQNANVPAGIKPATVLFDLSLPIPTKNTCIGTSLLAQAPTVSPSSK